MNDVKKALQDLLDRLPPDALQSQSDLDLLAGYLMEQQNQQGLDDFEGLSPDQMQQVFAGIDGFDGFRLQRDVALSQELLMQVPLVAMFYTMAEVLGERGVKLTSKGRLPARVVLPLHNLKNALIDDDDTLFRPRLEEDCPATFAARAIYREIGLIKVQHGKVLLTIKGKRLSRPDNIDKLFWLLFDFTCSRFNWGYTDGYDADPHVQAAFVFYMWLLANTPEEQEFGRFMVRVACAFPMFGDTEFLALYIRMLRVWQWIGLITVRHVENRYLDGAGYNTLKLTLLGQKLYCRKIL